VADTIICPAADALMDAYVGDQETCLLLGPRSDAAHALLQTRRLGHQAAHSTPAAAWECIRALIYRGWPSTTWEAGVPTTVWRTGSRS